MKRFFRFLARAVAFLTIIALVVMVGALLAQVNELQTQVGELTTRVQKVEQAGSVSIVPDPSRTPTRTPSRTPTATVTPAATPHFTVNSAWVNVRTGPGDVYPIIDAVPQGERFDIIARNRASSLNTLAGVLLRERSARLDLRAASEHKR